MRSDTEISSLKFVLDGLGMIWIPGAEALKLKQQLNMHSLEDLPVAAERAGCEICYADLPMNVSGFALVIADKPHIVVNRANSPQHQQYTVAHELGHHILHVNPPYDPNPLGFSSQDLTEFQAHMFATTLVIFVTKDEERKEMLRENPESSAALASSLFLTLGIILIPLLAYLFSRLFSHLFQRYSSVERK